MKVSPYSRSHFPYLQLMILAFFVNGTCFATETVTQRQLNHRNQSPELTTSPLANPLPTMLAENPDRCVKFRTESRYRTGFEHWVHNNNTCKAEAKCSVTTDVAPNPRRVTLAAGQKESLLTFRGSPARNFKASVVCKLTK